jgi:DMSO/TMAO reductase YedYZ molybdopterin-dependent catalytic subunit
MRDVLRAAGMDVDSISLGKVEAPDKARNIGLLGYDADEIGNQYCCSFPFDKAVDPFGDVLIAYEMNDAPIPRQHGYPVRAIVPGHAGARNCKFLEMVTVTDSPCDGHSNWHQYSVHAPDVPMRKIAEFYEYEDEIMADPAVQEMPVQSMITSPTPNEVISALQNGDESLRVKGIAWGGGGSGINRIDVSLDNGVHFTKAQVLEKPITERRRAEWSWSFFERDIPIPDEMRAKLKAGEPQELILTSKAVNTAWNVQPENIVYNAHGCCVNHWYRVPVTLCPKAKQNIKAPEGDFANKPTGGRFATPFRNLDHPDDLEIRQSHSKLAHVMGYGDDSSCTCGNDCEEGEGCLNQRFETSPSRLFARNRAAGQPSKCL